MKKIRLGISEFNPVWEDVSTNLETLSNQLESVSNMDLLLLPEMFATGFSMNIGKIAQPMDGSIVQWMKQISTEKKIAIAGSFSCKENGVYYNRLVFFDRGLLVGFYDKRHLFSFAKEDDFYTKGNQRVIFHWKGWRILPQICYDLRFPVFSKNKDDYDLMINLASWPKVRIGHWSKLLPARSIENQCFVVGVNRQGIDGHAIAHNGQSAVYFADGSVVSAHSTHNMEVYELNLDDLNSFRKRFPFMEDGDDFELRLD